MTTLNLSNRSIAFIALTVLLTILLLACAYFLGTRSRSGQGVVPSGDVSSDSVF
jgi:cell division protein ZapA (FtsZ GTPase activity inhibitor)